MITTLRVNIRDRERQKAFGAYLGGKMLGFVTVDPRTGYLDQIVVAPEEWGSALGAALLAEAKRRIAAAVSLPVGTYLDFGGSAAAQARSRRDLLVQRQKRSLSFRHRCSNCSTWCNGCSQRSTRSLASCSTWLSRPRTTPTR